MSETDRRPLILSLVLDEAARARFDAERTALFPTGRTAVGAHLTLFHAVPGERLEQVLADTAAEARAPGFDLAVREVIALGRGAAYRLHAEQLDALHRRLQRAWAPHLTPQDSRPLRAHVTVQNKVDPATARATVARLRAEHTPFTARAEALAVWRYDGGPWEPVAQFEFG